MGRRAPAKKRTAISRKTSSGSKFLHGITGRQGRGGRSHPSLLKGSTWGGTDKAYYKRGKR